MNRKCPSWLNEPFREETLQLKIREVIVNVCESANVEGAHTYSLRYRVNMSKRERVLDPTNHFDRFDYPR